MEERRMRDLNQKNAERQEFNDKGINSSNVYYVNQDRKDQARAALKGSGKDMAQALRDSHL